jgi:hypothetical protein
MDRKKEIYICEGPRNYEILALTSSKARRAAAGRYKEETKSTASLGILTLLYRANLKTHRVGRPHVLDVLDITLGRKENV